MKDTFHPPKVLLPICIVALLFGLLFGDPLTTLAKEEADEGTTSSTRSTTYQTANFQVIYRSAADQGTCDTQGGDVQDWPAEATAAMNYTIDILDDLINSGVPIVIEACYQLDSDPNSSSLAAAGPTTFLQQADVPALPIADRDYAVALANAIAGSDLNGNEPEIGASANSRVQWDFCTTNCTVDGARTDFVSTMVHEVLHGLGFFASFDADNNVGFYSNPPAIMDEYLIQTADGARLLAFENESEALLNAMTQGSGTVGFNGPATLAVNDNQPPFFYTPTEWQPGSSMSHWDDDHPTNLGRMMNAATGDGPSSRVVSAITLAALKDTGWSVYEDSDHGDGVLSAYGDAQHVNSADFVGHLKLGDAFSTEAVARTNDDSDDGIMRTNDWSVGNSGGQITATVMSNQVGTRGCLSGWVDWNRDNDFGDAQEQILNMQPVEVGAQNFTFAIPTSVSDTMVFHNARIRLLPDWDNDGTCNDQVTISPSIDVVGGEVEDYEWSLAGGTLVLPPQEFIERAYLPVILNAQ